MTNNDHSYTIVHLESTHVCTTGLLNVTVSVAYMDAGHGTWTLTHSQGRDIGLSVTKTNRWVREWLLKSLLHCVWSFVG